MNDEILAILEQLAEARASLESRKRFEAECQADVEQSPAYTHFRDAQFWRRESQREVDRLAARIREKALAVYAETGNKNPWPGVQIEEHMAVEFDENDALAWCRGRGGILVKLDKPAFLEAAPFLANAPVSNIKRQRVVIAKDLSQYLDSET